MFNRLLHSRAAQLAASSCLGAYLAFALRFTRWHVEGEDNLSAFRQNVPVIVAFWHECLALMPAGWNEMRRGNAGRRAAVLVSRHRDGQFIAAILARFAVDTVHGSTQSRDGRKPGADKGGAASMRALLARLARNEAVIVTPDGPRGPLRRAEAGVTALATLSGAPILPAAARLRHHIRLPSWDRMILPLPFGTGAIVCLPPMVVAPDDRERALAQLTAALTEAADRADTLTRSRLAR